MIRLLMPWPTVKRVMALGEIGHNSTTNEIKAGDGVHDWDSLPSMKSSGTQGVPFLMTAPPGLDVVLIETLLYSSAMDVIVLEAA